MHSVVEIGPDKRNGAAKAAPLTCPPKLGRSEVLVVALVGHLRPGRRVAVTRRKHDDRRANLHTGEKVDDILIGHADAAGRDGMADVFRLVGAMDTVQRVLVALVKVDCPRTERISRTARNALGVRTEPGLDLRRGDPVRPFSYTANCSDAGPRLLFLPTVTP